MIIKVEKEPIVTASLNIIGFRQDLVVLDGQIVKDLDLEKAVFQNLEILDISSKKGLPGKEIFANLIFQSIDWGSILKHFKRTREDEMKIYLTTCKVKGMPRFLPHTVDVEKGILTCEPIKEEEEGFTTVLVKHTFMPLLEFHIEKMLSDNILAYGNKKWTPYTKID